MLARLKREAGEEAALRFTAGREESAEEVSPAGIRIAGWAGCTGRWLVAWRLLFHAA